MVKIRLISVDPFSPPLELEIDALPAVIGRNGEAHVHVADRWVSDKHCELLERGGEIAVRDMQSAKGILVNGSPVAEAVLQPGDTLTIGIRTFRILYQRQGAGDAKGAKGHPPLEAVSPEQKGDEAI